MKRYAISAILAISVLAALNGCGRKNSQKDNLVSTHTTQAGETIAETAASTEAIKIDSSTDSTDHTGSGASQNTGSGNTESQNGKENTVKNVSTSVQTFKDGKISIEYPVVSNLNDGSVQKKVNELLAAHAKEIITAYSMDTAKDSLKITCKVVSADRKRITAVYTGTYSPEGAAYPTNIFYTNTIDTAFGKDLGLTDYADPYTLAGYILSEDCRFSGADVELLKELTAVKNETSIEDYTRMFQNADFPYNDNERGTDTIKFPETFSYEDQGTIYVAIPVTHALGDYAIVEYTPDTK